MTNTKRGIAYGMALVFLFTQSVYPEETAPSVRDTRITPTQGVISGEFYHGSILTGKLLIKVLMFGAVPQQGIHYVHEGTDIMSALLYAGGYSEQSKINAITIRRKHSKKLIKIDLEEILEDGLESIKLQDDDIITVPYNWRKDIATISLITGFISSMTGFTLAILAITKK